jgi:hypothetical protein
MRDDRLDALMGRHMRNIDAFEPDRTAGDIRLQAGDRVQRGGLPRTIGAEQCSNAVG